MTKKGNNISLQELELKIYHNMKKQTEELNKNIITLDKFLKITIILKNNIINRIISITSLVNSISIFIIIWINKAKTIIVICDTIRQIFNFIHF